MSTLYVTANGNFTTAATWALVNSTAFLDSISGNTTLTTSYVESSAFTPGAITIDGIAVRPASVTGSPSGTISVRLAQGGALVTGTEVTIDVADLPVCDTTNIAGGWVLFKFSTSVTLTAATAYTVSAKTSASSQVNLYRNGTAGNWSRALRTTTTQAPAAADDMLVGGEFTGSGAMTARTVTMDNTASTKFGSNPGTTTYKAGLGISKGGTVAWGTSASTNYLLTMENNVLVWSGGTHTMGTSGTPCPSTSTQILEITGTGYGNLYTFAVRSYGVSRRWGSPRTAGKQVVWCLLNGNAATNATTLNVDADTGWLDNDVIMVASTTQTYTESEAGTLNGNAGASSLTVDGFTGTGGGVLNAHSGTSPTQAEVILLTRNVMIRGAGNQYLAYDVADTATEDMGWSSLVQFNNANHLINTTTGSFSASYCSFYQTAANNTVTLTPTGSTWNNVTFNHCTFGTSSTNGGVGLNLYTATSGTNYTFNDLVIISLSPTPFSSNDIGGTITNIRAVGGSIAIGESAGVVGTISDLTVHSSFGVGFNGPYGYGTFANLTSWRNTTNGLLISQGAKGATTTLNGVTSFGNATSGLSFSQNGAYVGAFNIIGLLTAGDSTFATATGIVWSGTGQYGIFTFQSPQFGSTSGIYANHTTDLSFTNAGNRYVYLNNPILNGATKVANQTNNYVPSGVFATRIGQTDGVAQSWLATGNIILNSTTYHTAAPSMELQPLSATQYLEAPVPFTAVIDDGDTIDIAVYVRKDGSYNGAVEPQLVQKANAVAGLSVDTVKDTLSVAANNWELLNGTSATALDNTGASFVVRCIGTAGSVFVDDWSVA